jgi:hypothetical protein
MHIKYLITGKFGHPDRLRLDTIAGKEGETAEVDSARGNMLVERGLAEEVKGKAEPNKWSEIKHKKDQEPEVEHEVISAETIEEPPKPEVKPKRRGRKPGQKKKS